ncbi:MAG: alkaline phosphatase family protein [Anaerolineae bacterium]
MEEIYVPRVLVIGLDGATFSTLDPMMSAGRMPTLSGLVAAGVRAPLRSVFPPLTAPAWAPFMTGRNPGKHGIYEFLHRPSNGNSGVPVNASLLGAETLWSILSRQGRTIAVANVPLTYPLQAVNGLMLGDFLAPAGAPNLSYPEWLLPELEARYGQYPLSHRQVYHRRNVSAVLREIEAIQDHHTKVALDVIGRQRWDFAMVHFAGIDRLQHELWHLLDPSHPAHRPSESAAYRERALSFFSRVDASVAALMRAMGDDAIVIVMSDHGFGPIYRFVNMNTWLMARGYLRLRNCPLTRLRHRLFRAGVTPSLLYRFAMYVGIANVRLAQGMTRRQGLFRLVERFMLSLGDVDWSRTQAYSRGNYGQIFINLRGREPCGAVDPADYECVRARIVEDLKALVDETTGCPVVQQLLPESDAYSGDFAAQAPDINFLMSEGYKSLGTLTLASNRVIEPAFGNSGDHRMDGILIMKGPTVRVGQKLRRARIVDLAPTILHLLELPLERDMDGQVLLDALEADYVAGHRPALSQKSPPAAHPAEISYSPAEAAQIRERLANLGYWE